MRGIFIKLAAVSVFAVALLAVGVFVTNKVSAQTAQDCNSASPSFWGWIACYIGSPSQGIANAPTLFQGQKAIYDKIGTNGGGTASNNSSVYVEKAGSSIYLGQLASGVPDGNTFWNMSAAVTGCSSLDCPSKSFDTQANGTILAVFYPSDSFINSYGLTKTRSARNISFKPTMCFVRQDQKDMTSTVSLNNQGVADVEKVFVRCTYVPNICNSNRSDGSSANGCLGRNEETTILGDYTINTPVATDQYRIRIK